MKKVRPVHLYLAELGPQVHHYVVTNWQGVLDYIMTKQNLLCAPFKLVPTDVLVHVLVRTLQSYLALMCIEPSRVSKWQCRRFS